MRVYDREVRLSLKLLTNTPDIPDAVVRDDQNRIIYPQDPISLRILLDNPALLLPPEPIVPRFAYSGRVTLLVGREKKGKSTLAGYLSAVTSSGRSVDGESTKRGVVLYLCLEENLCDFTRRLVGFEADPDRILVQSYVSDCAVQLEKWVEKFNPSLVVIDTLATFVADKRPESSSSRDWTPLMQNIGRIARKSNVAILLVHHSKKDKSGEYRDSTAIGAGVDLIIKMMGGGSSIREFRCSGRWDTKDFSMRLRNDKRSYEVVGSVIALGDRIINYVRQNPGCSQRNILSHVEGKTDSIRKKLTELDSDGRLKVEKEGNAYAYYRNCMETAAGNSPDCLNGH